MRDKVLLLLTLCLLFGNVVQAQEMRTEIHTRVTEFDISWSTYSEFFEYDNVTLEGQLLSVVADGEVLNTASEVVYVAFGSSSCPTYGHFETNISLGYVNPNYYMACTDDYGMAPYDPGINTISYSFSLLFVNQSEGFSLNGQILVFLSMINLVDENVLPGIITFENSVASFEYPAVDDNWGVSNSTTSTSTNTTSTSNPDVTAGGDEFQLGFSGLDIFFLMSGAIFTTIILKRKTH